MSRLGKQKTHSKRHIRYGVHSTQLNHECKQGATNTGLEQRDTACEQESIPLVAVSVAVSVAASRQRADSEHGAAQLVDHYMYAAEQE
jgi:hypothetical protein